MDLLVPASGGYVLVSHIVFSKLSRELQRALIAETKTGYPTWDQIMDNYGNVINNLNKTRAKKPSVKNESKGEKPPKLVARINSTPTMNFATPVAKTVKSPVDNFYCRFCNVHGHSILHCPNYVSYEDRKKKCEELGLCVFCTSLSHTTNDCPGKADNLRKPCRFCKCKKHIGTLCPKRPVWKPRSVGSIDGNVCHNTKINELSNFLLPFMTMFLWGPQGPKEGFNMLVDTGSTRSYLSAKAAQILNLACKTMKIRQYEARTFLGCGVKLLKEATLEVYLPTGRYT